MDEHQRKRIGHLIQILELFKERNSTIPLQQVITFLQVACAPGIGVTDVARISQTHLASASRHVKALRSQRGDKSPLIAAVYGKDERTKPLILTEDGHQLITTVLAASFEVLTAFGSGIPPKDSPVICSHRDDSRSVAPNRVAWDPFGAT